MQELKQHRATLCKQLRDAKSETKAERARPNAAEEELQRVCDALQQAEQEQDEAWAARQQALTESTQSLVDQGVQQLRQKLATAKQELEPFCSQASASTPMEDVTKLQSQL